MSLKVLVVDDTVTYRMILTQALQAIPGVVVVGTANTGSVALSRIRQLRPDLVTLDQEMPDMSGLQVLEKIAVEFPETGVIMISSHTPRGGHITIRALELGAFDFISKSTMGARSEQTEALRAQLQAILSEFSRRKRGPSPVTPGKPSLISPPPNPVPPLAAMTKPRTRLAGKLRMVLIGVSTGGPNALAQVLPSLPADLAVPILIVQHMPPLFTGYLAQSLNDKCRLRVKEAEDGEVATGGLAYIAPGGRHLKVQRSPEDKIVLCLSDEPPENNCRPAADVLFRSASIHFPGSCCVVIMTGMGRDGTLGMRLLKRQGAVTMAQDEGSCVVYGMPKEAVEAGVVDQVLPLEGLGAAVLANVKAFA